MSAKKWGILQMSVSYSTIIPNLSVKKVFSETYGTISGDFIFLLHPINVRQNVCSPHLCRFFQETIPNLSVS